MEWEGCEALGAGVDGWSDGGWIGRGDRVVVYGRVGEGRQMK